jgi:hypothetical protein
MVCGLSAAGRDAGPGEPIRLGRRGFGSAPDADRGVRARLWRVRRAPVATRLVKTVYMP